MKSVFDTLEARGFIAQCSDPQLRERLAKESVTLYVGFDPTADSLHLGHLVPIIALAHFQRAGHRSIALVGGATGMVGDPSGRSAERNLLTAEQVAHNCAAVKRQMAKFLDFEGENPAVLRDNNEWIGQMSFIDWLRDVGKHFTINYMLAKESVRRRLSSLLTEADILDWAGLCQALNRGLGGDMLVDPRAAISLRITQRAKDAIVRAAETGEIDDRARSLIVTGLNDALRSRRLLEAKPVAQAHGGEEIPDLMDLSLSDLEFHNRVAVSAAFEGLIAPCTVSRDGISFTEFSYMTMQAYDYLHLFQECKCTLQCGGNDQWGNITAGMDLIRRVHGAQVASLTFPLVRTSSGEKFGKTAGNAIWLDPDRTTPYDFYQYWIRTDDRDVENHLKLFTFLELDEIEAIAAEHTRSPEARTAQRRLAQEMTRQVHGVEMLERVERASQILYGGEIQGLTDADLSVILGDAPASDVPRADLETGLALTDLLVRTGLCAAKGEAKRLIKGGGVYLNNIKQDQTDRAVTLSDLATETMIVLRTGKRNYHLVRAVG